MENSVKADYLDFFLASKEEAENKLKELNISPK